MKLFDCISERIARYIINRNGGLRVVKRDICVEREKEIDRLKVKIIESEKVFADIKLGIQQLKFMTESLLDKDLELKKSRLEWERTFNSVPDIIFILTMDFNIKRINKSYLDKVGGEEEDYIGLNYYNLLYDSNVTNKNNLERYICKNPIFIPKLMGWYLVTISDLIDVCGDVFGYVLVARDITDQIKSENFLKMILNDHEGSMCRFDPDFTITFANKNYANDHGMKIEDIIGKNIIDIHISDENYIRELKSVLETLTRENDTDKRIFVCKNNKGELAKYEKIHKAIFNGRDVPIEYQCITKKLYNED